MAICDRQTNATCHTTRLTCGETILPIAQDKRIIWPDTLSVGTDGYLYFTANQLNRQAGFHHGVDRRKKPYELLRIRIGAGPVLLGR